MGTAAGLPNLGRKEGDVVALFCVGCEAGHVLADLFDECLRILVSKLGQRVTQPVETIGNARILYSLGNFVFDYYPDDPEESIGWVAILDFPADGSRPVGLRTIPVRMTPAGVPEPVAIPAR